MLEVVFLPYIAAMWDSMESVWRAADADPNVKALVVPVPYHEVSQRGKLSKLRYEGDFMPSDIPVVDYKSYDFTERKPDVIYMHNPYDSNNHVTNVHKDFYSSRMRKHTRMLVYLPYNASGEKSVTANIARMESFRMFDRIIVDTNQLADSFAEHVSRDKIAAMGSPKFDKVVQERGKPVQLPDQWQSIIDGRRTVLLNTTLNDILKNGTAFICKLKATIAAFTDKPDLMLWWRPHPLSAVTIRTMRPILYGEYAAIVHSFIDRRTGIYDNTSDVHRAINAADAYYGNESSLKQLFGLTGKPVVFMMFKNSTRGELPVDAGVEYLVPYQYRKDISKPLSREAYIIRELSPRADFYLFLRDYIIKHAEHAADQIEAFSRNIVNANGTAGEKIHAYIMEQMKTARPKP